MIDKLIKLSIARRWLVMFFVLVVGALGIWNYQKLPIDAVPDITNVQVQINTGAPGYSPLEVEQRITYLVELAITGLPYVESNDCNRPKAICRQALNRLWAQLPPASERSFTTRFTQTRMPSNPMVRNTMPPHCAPCRIG